MNRPIVRLYGLVVVLFALLVAFTSRWTIFEASSLRENKLNARTLLEQQRIARGPIVAAGGTVLARSRRGSEGVYERTYPTRSLFANTVGYYFTDRGSTGIERFRSAYLNGQTDTGLQAILDQLQGHKPRGQKVVTTLDPKAQQVAVEALGEHQGGVVALEPRTGRVTVMASSPSFDPNTVSSAADFERLTHDSQSPLVNRATQFGYAPGSTFKVVTATAAIDTGQFTPESTVDGRDNVPISGVPLQNDNNESFGPITLTEAMAHSVNTVWAQVAEKVGKPTMGRYMNRFGFDRKPKLDYPATEMSTSGEMENGRIVPPTSARVDVGRMGIGQDKLAVVPAADGRGRLGGGRPRHADGPPPDLPDRRLRRPDDPARDAARAVQGDEKVDGRRCHHDDGSRRQRRHRHLGADPRRAGGRQDRHRRDADRHGHQQRLVHRLRARPESDRGDRRDPQGRARTGRVVRRPCRPPGDGTAAP